MSQVANTTTNAQVANTTTKEKQSSLFMYIILFIFSILFIVIGLSVVKKYNVYDTQINGKVIESNCSNILNYNRKFSYSCNVKLEYYVKELQTTRTQIIQTSNVIYSVGDNISLRYNSANSSDIILESDSNKLSGYIFAGIGIFLLVIIFLTMVGIISPLQTVSYSTPYITSTSGTNYYKPYQTYLTPEQTFASSLGVALGSKIANKI